MAEIRITKKDENTFLVEVMEGSTSTKHTVTVRDEDYEHLMGRRISKEDLLRKSFGFLLKREPKEAILQSFDVMVIQKYFPEFEKEIRD